MSLHQANDVLHPQLPSPWGGGGGGGSALTAGRFIANRVHPSPDPFPQRKGRSDIARNFDFARNGFENAIGVAQDFVVPETDHTVAVRFDGRSPRRVGLNRMLAPVAFDGDPKTAARKVDHVAANGKLPRELHTHLPVAQMRPQQTFRIRHVAPQLARDAGQSLLGQGRTPPPSLPLKGEGLGVAY